MTLYCITLHCIAFAPHCTALYDTLTRLRAELGVLHLDRDLDLDLLLLLLLLLRRRRGALGARARHAHARDGAVDLRWGRLC